MFFDTCGTWQEKGGTWHEKGGTWQEKGGRGQCFSPEGVITNPRYLYELVVQTCQVF